MQTKVDLSNWEHLWSHTYFGGSWRFPNQRAIVKAKISPKLTWALALNNSLGSYGTYSVGLEMKEVGNLNSVKFGVKFWLDL
jgi:hypothetical protein